MEASERFLRTAVRVFTVFAWLSLSIQTLVGITTLVIGGPTVPVGGMEVPARVVGILHMVAAVLYFFLFMFIAHLTRLVLDVHQHVSRAGASAS